MTHADDTQERFEQAGEPDLMRVWNWLVQFANVCDSLSEPMVRRLCDLVIEHRAIGTPFDRHLRGRVEEILDGA